MGGERLDDQGCDRRAPRFGRLWPGPASRLPKLEEPWWKEAARLVMALAWIVGLTLWTFSQFAFFAQASYEYSDALLTTSVVVRTLPYLWLLSLFPAVGFGVVWYAYSWLPSRPSRRSLDPAGRLLRARTLMTLAVALFFAQLIYRIWTFVPFIGADTGLASLALLRIQGWEEYAEVTMRMLWFLEGVALFGAFFLVLQACQLVRELGGQPRKLLLLLAPIVALGLSIPVAGRYPFLLSASANVLSAVEEWPEDARLLIHGGGGDEDLQRIDRLFFATHGPEGEWMTQGDVRELRHFDIKPDLAAVCETVLLPYSSILTATGLSLDLSAVHPDGRAPSLVFEIPAHGEELRVYGPDGNIRTINSHEFEDLSFTATWVVLKADTALDGTYILEFLGRLRDRGVRRVSLAVLSMGPFLPPKQSVSLHMGERGGLTLYEPSTGRDVIYVSRWTPAPPPPCEWDSYREIRWTEKSFLVPRPGELEETIAVRSDGSYQELVRRLGGAIAAHVREIHVQVSAGDPPN